MTCLKECMIRFSKKKSEYSFKYIGINLVLEMFKERYTLIKPLLRALSHEELLFGSQLNHCFQ